MTEDNSFSIEVTNAWTLVAVSGGILLLYCMSRIIAMQRRVRDLEARPPVDDILMRGMIRQQVSEMVSELEQSIRVRTAVVKPVKEPFGPVLQAVQAETLVNQAVQVAVQPNDKAAVQAAVQSNTVLEKEQVDSSPPKNEVVMDLPLAPPNSAESKTKKKVKKAKA